MLGSAFDNDSHSVTLDLLTSEDLEALRQASGVSTQTAKPEVAQTIRSKRYLILTYHGEFDKVHYPMALTLSEIDDVSELKRTIVRLRDELEQMKRSPLDHQSLAELERLVMASQSERDALARELNDYSIENSRLTALVETLKAENHSLRCRGDKPGSGRRPQTSSTLTPTSLRRHNNVTGHSPIHRSGMRNSSPRQLSRVSSPANSTRGGSGRSPRVLKNPGVSQTRGLNTRSPRNRLIPGLPPGYQSPYSQMQTRSPLGSIRSVPTSPKHIDINDSPSRNQEARYNAPKMRSSGIRASESKEAFKTASLSEVDARLQALQNFLKNQKARSSMSSQ